MTSGQIPDPLSDAWERAFNDPNVAIDIGRNVVCDLCNTPWTNRTETGGLIASNYAIGPCCALRFTSDCVKYGEEHSISVLPMPGVSFADFVVWYRIVTGNNYIRVLTGADAKSHRRREMLTPMPGTAVTINELAEYICDGNVNEYDKAVAWVTNLHSVLRMNGTWVYPKREQVWKKTATGFVRTL